MLLTASPSKLQGTVEIPSSKSHTIQGLTFALLAKGESILRNPLDSGDTQAGLAMIRAFGAKVEVGEVWKITGTGGHIAAPENVIDVMNSGTTLYIAMTIAALGDGYTVFTGDAQIRRRPADKLLLAINDLGATAFSTRGNDRAPLVIRGPLRGGETTIECPTSQYLTSLLIGCAISENECIINVPLLHEQPYVHMTLRWLDELGIKYEASDNLDRFVVAPGQKYPAFDKPMAGDFSSATFFLCGAAICGGEVTLTGLDMADSQGDKAVVDYLRVMGAEISETEAGLRVTAPKGLQGSEIDLNATPDALPAMAVAACFAEGTTRLVNVPQARLKETDRIAVMAAELTKLGAKITEQEDGLVIEGSKLKGGRVCGHDDHRVVMSLALAGMAGTEPITIDTAEAVAVTFPDFPQRMAGLGGEVTMSEG